jgi:hypothetical protein
MLSRKRTLSFIAVIIAVLIAVWLALMLNCPRVGIALTSKARNLHRLKNRTALPQTSDFDARVTLDELLRPGDDSYRWSTERAARIQGDVIDVGYARPEATNCWNPCRRDIHILLANHAGAAKNEHVVLEVTPNLQPIFESGLSEDNLRTQLVGHWCEFEGWLYFDVGHADNSENTATHNPTNWRATAWEIHPVTRIRVVK